MPSAKKIKRLYDYYDYLSWEDGERWEIIDGEAYNMTPAPNFRHQYIAGNIYYALKSKLSGKTCTALIAPLDVVLSEYDVVQPDVMVVCNPKKITESHVKGAPDLVIEVLSPATALKDKREKKALYEKSGVKEYLIIDPDEGYAEQYILKKNGFEGPQIFGVRDTMTLVSLKGIKLRLSRIFRDPKTRL